MLIGFVLIVVQLDNVRNGKTEAPGRIVSDAVLPAQTFFTGLGRRITSIWKSLTKVTDLEEENKRLQAQLYALKEEQELFSRTREENKNLRKLLEISEVQQGRVIAAEVVARDPDNWFRSIRINKGSRSGVKKDMVAISPDGIVGRVVETSDNTSKIRLIFSERSAIPAQLVSSGELGVVYGEGKNTCVMRYINADAQVKIGEQVISSRLGRIYPPGKILGTVSKLYGRDQLLYQAVQVKPSVQFGNLEYVLLIERQNAQ